MFIFLFQRLSVLLLKGKSALFLNSIPPKNCFWFYFRDIRNLPWKIRKIFTRLQTNIWSPT